MKKRVYVAVAALVATALIVLWLVDRPTPAPEEAAVAVTEERSLPSWAPPKPIATPAHLPDPRGQDGHGPPPEAEALLPERPKAGPKLLEMMRFERGGTVASLDLAMMRLQAFKALAAPTADQMKEMSEVERSLEVLNAQLAQQSKDIDAFDVNAPPADARVDRGATVTLASVLTMDDKRIASLVHEDASPETLAAVKRELTSMGKSLSGLNIPEGMRNTVQDRLMPVMEAIAEAPKATDQAEARALIERRKAYFLRVAGEMASSRR